MEHEENEQPLRVQMPSVRSHMVEADREQTGPMPALQAAEMGHARLGSIYILETEDDRFVKIGYTTRMTMRLEQHRKFAESGMATGVKLIAFFPGTLRTETALHRLFTPYRVRTEWYRRHEVLEHIRLYGFSPAATETPMREADAPKTSPVLLTVAAAAARLGIKARRMLDYADKIPSRKVPNPRSGKSVLMFEQTGVECLAERRKEFKELGMCAGRGSQADVIQLRAEVALLRAKLER